MKCITEKNIELNKGSVVTIGNFDGVHLGHIVLINMIKKLKRDKYTDCNTVVFSFSPHPMAFFNKSKFNFIFNDEEKCHIFEDMGVDVLVEYPFDNDTKNMSQDEFINDVLIEKLNCKALVVGENWHFGKDKQGSALSIKAALEKMGVEVIIIKSTLYNNEKLGSTTIRKIIADGDLEEANTLLGKSYFISGEVVYGKQLGRTIGFPTMNIIPPDDKLLPPNGVYISFVHIDGVVHQSITNVGVNPTVDGEKTTVESHVLNYDDDAYGKKIKVELIKKIRDEKKFNSIDELKNEIDRNVKYLKEYIAD